MSSLIFIILIANTLLLVYIALIARRFSNKEKFQDWQEKQRIERAEIEGLTKFYGSFDNLLKEKPLYIANKQLALWKSLGISKKEIKKILETFLITSIEGKKLMINNFREYIFARSTIEKNKVLEK
jgi:hypothetical protein